MSAPLPAALPLFVTGLGTLGLLGWRRNRTGRPQPREPKSLEFLREADVTWSASLRYPRMARFIPKQLKPPATTRPIQLNHIGTVQPAITAGQPRKIRNTWNSATSAKITLANIVKVFWFMAQSPPKLSVASIN